MAVYKYPGYETGQGWTLEPGNLEGGFWERYKGILGASPPILAYCSPRIPLKIPRFKCPPLACFIPWVSIRLKGLIRGYVVWAILRLFWGYVRVILGLYGAIRDYKGLL